MVGTGLKACGIFVAGITGAHTYITLMEDRGAMRQYLAKQETITSETRHQAREYAAKISTSDLGDDLIRLGALFGGLYLAFSPRKKEDSSNKRDKN